jgi:4-amino-4-deoxy-L-arabinose transferase-like glycosyltransferase
VHDGPELTERPRWSRAERWLFATIVIAAFALRLAAVFQYEAHHPNAAHLSIDEASYDRWARAIAGGDWIGKEVFFQEPLYPYVLGVLYKVFGPHALVARIFQCVLWAATVALAGLLARRLFGRAAGLLAAFAMAVYWPGFLFPAFLLKENLFLPVLLLFVLALLDGRWLAAGVLAGLGALLRGNVLVLLPVFAAWPFLRARGLRGVGIFLAGCAFVLLPVAARNLAVGGVFLPTTSGAGTNLYGGNHLGNPFGRASEPEFVRAIPEHEAGDWRREAERRVGRPLDPAQVSAYWRGEILRSVREHPAAHLAILWRKLRLSLGRYEVPDDHCLYWDARFVALARFPWPGFGLLGALGIAGLVLLALEFRSRRPAVEVAAVLLLYLGTIVLTVTSDRGRLPLAPLLAPFAAWTVVWAFRAAAARRQDAIVRLALALFVGVVAVEMRVLPDAEIAEDLDERDSNWAVQLLRDEHRLQDARAIAERLVREHPRSARSRVLLAEIDFRDGRAADALARVEPLAREPSLNARERFRAESLAAWIQLDLGNWSAAADAFRRARAFDGDAQELREGLARALIGAADSSRGASGLAPAEEAAALLTGGDEVLLAQAEFLRGRAILEKPPADEGERKRGQDSIQSALARLQPLAQSTSAPADVRRRARLVGGAIQLYRGNWKPAENHFRAAIAIADDAGAELGLLQALVGADETTPERVEEARRIADCLAASTPGLDDLRRRIDALRATATTPAPPPPR